MKIKNIIEAAEKNQKVVVFVDEQIKHAGSRKGIVTNIRLSGCRGIGVRFEGMDYDTWFHEKPGTDKRSRYMDSLSFYENKEQLWMNTIESNNVWDIFKKHYGDTGKSFCDIQNDAAACKIIYDEFWASLPKTERVRSTNEINIGDKFMYTANPRGSGIFIPKIGQIFKIETKEDIASISIEMVERGRGWERVINTESQILTQIAESTL